MQTSPVNGCASLVSICSHTLGSVENISNDACGAVMLKLF